MNQRFFIIIIILLVPYPYNNETIFTTATKVYGDFGGSPTRTLCDSTDVSVCGELRLQYPVCS